MAKQDEILATLLGCGIGDLNLLDNINYDLDDILEELIEDNSLSLYNIFTKIFIKGAIELQERFNLRAEEIKQKINDILIKEKEKWINSGEIQGGNLKKAKNIKN